MNLRYKLIFRKLLYSYIIACYFSRIPAFFIDFQKGFPPDDFKPILMHEVISLNLMHEVISFLLSPLLTPIVLYAETTLAFAWGNIIYEYLLPFVTFLVVGLLSWFTQGKLQSSV